MSTFAHQSTQRTSRLVPLVLALALITIIAAALYLPSLSLPLSFDDAWSVRLVRDFSALDLFTRTQNFGYYRPLYLAYYRLAGLAGASGPLLLHLLCVAAHAINSGLVYFVARTFLRGSPHNRAIALTTALLFACNPLSVQAVALPAGLNHLIALIFLQLAVLSYARCRSVIPLQGMPWLAATCTFSLIAFLANEVALCVPGLCLAYEAARVAQGERISRRVWPLAVVTALALAYAAVYTLIPKGTAPPFVFTLDGALQRMFIALQALAHPLVWLLSPFEISGLATVVVSLAIMGLLVAYLWRVTPVALVGGAVLFAAGVALPILRLPTGYVENAQRVFYVASLGASLAWAALVIAAANAIHTRWSRIAEAVARIACSIVVAVPGALYSFDTQRFYARASEPVRAIATNGAQLQPDETLLALNVPEWVAVPQRRFPLFIEGAILMADYVDGRDLVFSNTGLDRQVAVQHFQLPYQPELRYAFKTFGPDVSPAPGATAFYTATRVLNVAYAPDGPHTVWLGGASAVRPEQIEARFGPQLALVRQHVLPCKDGWVVALQWRKQPPTPKKGGGSPIEGELPRTLSAFAQAFEVGGGPMTQKDGAPLAGLLQFADLPNDADIVDRRVLTTTSVMQPGALYVGIYDFTNNARLVATDAANKPLDGNAFSIPLPPRDAGTECR